MSDSPEEQQSTGVLGRIGSWLSPWRGKGPKSPTENASLTSDQALKSEEEEESEESVRHWASNQEWEEKKQQSSSLSPLSRDIFPCEERDATQSAHKDNSAVNRTKTARGGPEEEEFVECRKKRAGQGKEREDSSYGASVSGKPEKNASHLTHQSSSEQGVVWDSDQAHTQDQAQAGRRLHVYLEETSVIHCGQDASAGQNVVQVTKKDLKFVPKTKAPSRVDLSFSSTSAESKRTNVSPAAGAHSYYSALEGVSLKSGKDSESGPESEGQTQADSMGRKNTARRKFRKNSQGDEGNSSQDKMPSNTQPVPEGVPTSDSSMTSPEGKSPETHMGESPANSSSKHNPSSQASPEECNTSCPNSVKQLEKFQDSNSAIAATLASVIDGGTDMEDDDSLYRVERKTETPESKRRSIKVSRSEVKLFSKNVPLNSNQGPTGASQDFKAATKNNNDEATEKLKTEIDARLHELKNIDEEPKPVVGRIADKISLFEQPAAVFNKLTSQTTRSADVSPVRKATDRVKADFLSSEKRSRSAERYDTPGLSSASPVREKPLTIKERARNFTAGYKAEDKPPLPQKPAMTGMSQKAVSSVVSVATAASKSTKLDHQGKLDTKEQIQRAKSEITLKPDGQGTTALAGKISIPKGTSTDDTVASKTADQGTKPSSVETDVLAKGPGGLTELSNSISPSCKGPSRTGSRSKRRKSRDPTSPTSPTSPISPNSENKPDCFKSTGTLKEQQVDDTKEAASSSKQLIGKASLSSDKVQGNISDTKQKASRKEMEGLEKQRKQLDSSIKKENIDKAVNRQEESPEPSANKDEPDNAARSRTKPPIDKDLLILAQKDERAGGNSLLFTQRREKIFKDSREIPASFSSPAVEHVEKTPSVAPEPTNELPKLGKESSLQSELKSKGKKREPNEKDTGTRIPQSSNKDIEQINQAESGDVEKLEQVEVEKTNQIERKNKDKPQQLLHSDKNTTETKVSDSRDGASGTEGSAARDDKRKNETQPIKIITNPKTNLTVPASSSDLPAIKHIRHTGNTDPEKTAVCAVSHTDQAVSVTQSDKGPSKMMSVPSESTKTGAATEPAVIRAEAQPRSPDESCAHGANDAQLCSSDSIIKATTAAEKVTVTAADGTPALITDMSERQSFSGDSTPIFVRKSVSTDVAGWDERENCATVKSVSSEVSEDVMKVAPRQYEQSKNTESKSDIFSLKDRRKIAESPSDSAAPGSVVNVETAEKVFISPMKQLPPVGNGDISPHPQHHTEESSKLSQTTKAPTSLQANKPITDSTKLSTTKKLHLPRGLSKDDSATQRDAPSSWLDVDFPKQKLKVAAPKLSSSGSESNLLDTPGELDDDDFIEKIKNLCAPFSLPPRKHNPLRQPQPPFALPAIREDRFEKPFDPEEFKFGLRKKNQFTMDSTPSLLASKLQENETKSGLKPARASLADRSMLLSILDSRLRDNTSVKDEENVREEKDDQIKVKSRLEGSCVLSSLTSSILRGKRNGVQNQAEGTSSGEVSPSEANLVSPVFLPPPSPTAPAPQKHLLALSNREEAQAVVSDSGPPLPSFNDIKMPDYLEKYLPREPAKPVHSTQGEEQARTKVLEKMTTAASGGEAELPVKPGLLFPDAAPPCFPEIPPVTHPTLPELRQPPAQPQRKLSNNIRSAKGFHKRPGKMVLFEKSQFSGQAHEIYRDVADATSMQLSPVISVKVVRGCWVLYEKPNFQGRPIALEEGGLELANMWAQPETEPQNKPPMLIGSIRLAVLDYSLPHIDLFTEPEGHGRVTPYHDDMIETGSFGIPQSTASVRVHSGVWLVFSDPGFQGMIAVLEPGEYPYPESWGFPSPFVGSLRPLKMGGFKVEYPNEVKAVVYEKPGLDGACLEIDSDMFSLCDSEGDMATEGINVDSVKLKSVGSLKIVGGLWVGYSEPGFEGQQYILEEGEYLDCSDWGGSDQLLSLRPVLADFMSPHLKMFSDRHFGERGVNIDLTVPVINMDDTGYGLKTQSVDVISGVWVVFEEPGFCGESYILEKGLYESPEDWGALQPKVASVMPVALDHFEHTVKFKVQLFSDCGFQGSVLPLEDSVSSLPDGVSVASCKVLAGSWLAFEGQDFTGGMYVLEVGNYSDLRAMGCVNTSSSILSLQTVGFAFSLPSITLFERCGLWGKRVVLSDGSVNLLAGGCSRVQSVLVEGGIWVLYEGINYRGRQILLKPGEVPDWRAFSSWQKVGSLRPLLQRRVHFRLRNRQTGLMMSVTGDLDDVKLLRIQETEETDGFEQIWFYENGRLHCKLLEDCCLSPSGSVVMAGSRVGLTPEPENHIHLWSITPEGFIRYTPTSDLVLEVKGGHHYDKNQVILKPLELSKLQQRWDVEII